MNNPDGYKRITIWQPNSAFVADLYARDFRSVISPTFAVEYFDSGSGSDAAIAINREFNVIAVNEPNIDFIRKMQLIGCPVRFVACGLGKTVLWLDKTIFDPVSNRPGSADFAADNLRFRNSLFYAQIDDVTDLLQLFGFYGKSVIEDAGVYYLAGEDELYAEYLWTITGATAPPTIDPYGRLVTDGQATLTFEFPLGGATLSMAAGAADEENVDNRRVDVLDYSGGVMDTIGTDEELELPGAAWKLKVYLNSIGAGTDAKTRPPIIRVVDPGRYTGDVTPRTGLIPVDCSTPVVAPLWAITSPPEPDRIVVADNAGILQMCAINAPNWTFITDYSTFTTNPIIFYDSEDDWLIYTNGADIRKRHLFTTANDHLIMSGVSRFTVDVVNKFIYVFESPGTANLWVRYDYDGSGGVTVITDIVVSSFNVEFGALDYDSDFLYYNRNSGVTNGKSMRRGNVATGFREELFLVSGSTFFSQQGSNAIMSANGNGYVWTDSYVASSQRSLKRIDLSAQTSTDVNNDSRWRGVWRDIYRDKIYYITPTPATTTGDVHRCNPDGTEDEIIGIVPQYFGGVTINTMAMIHAD